MAAAEFIHDYAFVNQNNGGGGPGTFVEPNLNEIADRGYDLQYHEPPPQTQPTQLYFTWTTRQGETVHSDTPPLNTDTTIIELICNRVIRNAMPAYKSIDVHEQCMTQLPYHLEILRIPKCRIRTFPTLPSTIREVYAEENDFFVLPDFSSYLNLIVLEFGNGRIERLTNPLSPNLARFNLSDNAVRLVEINPYPESLPNIQAYGNPDAMKVNIHPQTYQTRVQRNYERIEVRRNLNRNELLPINPDRENLLQPPRAIVYNDAQNIHDTGIQKSVAKNIYYISVWGPTFPRLAKPQLMDTIKITLNKYSDKIHIIEHGIMKKIKQFYNKLSGGILNRDIKNVIHEINLRLNTPYSMHGITLFSLVERIWCRINHFPEETKITALQRFCEEVIEGKPYCTNGFMVRMVNVLQGLDENIIMRLETREIMQSRVPLTMKRVREKGNWKEGEEPWEFYRDCFVETCKDLDDCDEIIPIRRKEWASIFFDELVDEIIKHYNPLINVDNTPNFPELCMKYKTQFIDTQFADMKLPDEKWAKAFCISQLVN